MVGQKGMRAVIGWAEMEENCDWLGTYHSQAQRRATELRSNNMESEKKERERGKLINRVHFIHRGNPMCFT